MHLSAKLAVLLTVTGLSLRSEVLPKRTVTSETLLFLKKTFPYSPAAILPEETITEDRSANVILLPKITVTRRMMPTLEGSDLLTKEGLAELFLKKYPGASFKGQSPVDSQVTNYAAVMHKDAVRLQRLKDLKDTVETLERVGTDAEARNLNEMIYRTFIRNLTDKEKAMDRSVNGGRAGS